MMRSDREVIAQLLCAQRDLIKHGGFPLHVIECDRLMAKVRTMGAGSLRVVEMMNLGFEPVTYYRGRAYFDHEIHLIPRGSTVMATTSLVCATRKAA